MYYGRVAVQFQPAGQQEGQCHVWICSRMSCVQQGHATRNNVANGRGDSLLGSNIIVLGRVLLKDYNSLGVHIVLGLNEYNSLGNKPLL